MFRACHTTSMTHHAINIPNPLACRCSHHVLSRIVLSCQLFYFCAFFCTFLQLSQLGSAQVEHLHNVRSIRNKSGVFVNIQNVDLIALTERWLRTDDTDNLIASFTPLSYRCFHTLYYTERMQSQFVYSG